MKHGLLTCGPALVDSRVPEVAGAVHVADIADDLAIANRLSSISHPPLTFARCLHGCFNRIREGVARHNKIGRWPDRLRIGLGGPGVLAHAAELAGVHEGAHGARPHVGVRRCRHIAGPPTNTRQRARRQLSTWCRPPPPTHARVLRERAATCTSMRVWHASSHSLAVSAGHGPVV